MCRGFGPAHGGARCATMSAPLWGLRPPLRHAAYTSAPVPLSHNHAHVGALKKAGYRSAALYLARAKQRHTQLQFEISEGLDLYLQGVGRSLKRGLGPPDRAASIELNTFSRASDT